MTRLPSIALASICVSCAPLSAGTQYFGRATPLCAILTSEQTYAGQPVLVAALLTHTPHGRQLYSPECDRGATLSGSSEAWDRQAKTVVEAALGNDEGARVPVVVSGVFRPWTRFENGRSVITVGGPVIEDAKVVAARQP